MVSQVLARRAFDFRSAEKEKKKWLKFSFFFFFWVVFFFDLCPCFDDCTNHDKHTCQFMKIYSDEVERKKKCLHKRAPFHAHRLKRLYFIPRTIFGQHIVDLSSTLPSMKCHPCHPSYIWLNGNLMLRTGRAVFCFLIRTSDADLFVLFMINTLYTRKRQVKMHSAVRIDAHSLHLLVLSACFSWLFPFMSPYWKATRIRFWSFHAICWENTFSPTEIKTTAAAADYKWLKWNISKALLGRSVQIVERANV